MQERHETTLRTLEILHADNTLLILNLTQLHNADLISQFRSTERYPGLPRDEVIRRAVAHRMQIAADAAQKKIDAAQKKAQTAQRKAVAAEKKKEREDRRAQKGAVAPADATARPGEKRPAGDNGGVQEHHESVDSETSLDSTLFPPTTEGDAALRSPICRVPFADLGPHTDHRDKRSRKNQVNRGQ